MNSQPEQRRLCLLVDQNLSSYLDSAASLLTKDIEKNLLISLSQVFIRIKKWIKEYEYNSDSGEDDPAISIDYDDCSDLPHLHSDDHHCLTRILSHLMSVLAFENPFVQHLTGNILVAIYELLVAYEGDWEEFINRVSLFMTHAIDNSLSAHMESIIAEAKNSDFVLPVQIVPLKMKKSSCWFVPAALTRVLRNIMKTLKRDFNSEIYDVYICLSMGIISRIPWHLLNDVSVVQTEESVGCLAGDVVLHSSNPQQKSKSVFKGNLLQFFCSLDENHNVVESGAVSERTQLLVSAVSNLIPDLLSWCLGEQGGSNCVDLHHYFRHKLLDDILFKMLLLLLEVPVYANRCIDEEEAYSTAKTSIIFLVSDIFNPINIFHLFLSEIHYDHQVLLDYLISKDSGPCSAEYLLRCLRVICTSWYRFVEFPRINGTSSNSKRRKLLVDCVDFEGLSSTLPVNHGRLPSLHGAKCKKEYACESSRKLSLEDAKVCLLSLKESVENLRERDLFPYNPQVLLKRLRKFEDLCLLC